ncbi:MAG: MerR family transcriptional regulator [Thermotogota bacterium]
MKIGEFAQKFNINKETVRFYTNKLLLNPIKTRTHFEYSEKCVEDMTTIMRLKDMGFTLQEIAKYLSFFRNSTKRTLFMRDELFQFFDQKIQDMEEQIEDLIQAKEELINRRDEIKEKYEIVQQKQENIGLPLDCLNKLACPKCSANLSIENGDIAHNYIMNGTLHCECGYTAQIKEGIIVFDGVIYENPIYDQLNLLKGDEVSPPEYTSIVSGANNWVQQQLVKENLQGKIMFDYMTQGGVRDNQILERLMEKDEVFLYIAMDLHFDQILNFKRILSMQEKSPKVIFLAGSYQNAPIKRNSCDYITSLLGLQTYSISHGQFPIKGILDFLKPEGKWFETFACVADPKMVNEKFRDKRDTLHCQYVKNKLSEEMKTSFVSAGETQEKGELSFYLKEDAQLAFFSFIGQKKS